MPHNTLIYPTGNYQLNYSRSEISFLLCNKEVICLTDKTILTCKFVVSHKPISTRCARLCIFLTLIKLLYHCKILALFACLTCIDGRLKFQSLSLLVHEHTVHMHKEQYLQLPPQQAKIVQL